MPEHAVGARACLSKSPKRRCGATKATNSRSSAHEIAAGSHTDTSNAALRRCTAVLLWKHVTNAAANSSHSTLRLPLVSKTPKMCSTAAALPACSPTYQHTHCHTSHALLGGLLAPVARCAAPARSCADPSCAAARPAAHAASRPPSPSRYARATMSACGRCRPRRADGDPAPGWPRLSTGGRETP